MQSALMTAKRKRHYVRFSLRTMLVVLTAFAVWLGVQANRANRQRAVVRWVTENGGWVHYDWQFHKRNGIDIFISGNRPPGPAWLRRQIGDDYFQSVVGIGAEVDDVSPLVGLSSLESLYIDGPVNDLTPLARLSRLKRLGLTATRVRDLSPLVDLSDLEVLHLNESPVGDLAPLRKFIRLEELSLANTQARNLSPLTRLPQLRILYLDRNQVADLESLAGLSSLTDLRIHDPLFSDDRLRELQRTLPKIRVSR